MTDKPRSIADLLMRTPATCYTDCDAYGRMVGCYFNHLPEIDEHLLTNFAWSTTEKPNLRVDEHFMLYHDHRRQHSLCVVWFNDSPVMVIQNAGREGDDHHERFIISAAKYRAMVEEIRTAAERHAGVAEIVEVAVHEPNEGIFIFYGHDVRIPLEVSA